MTCERAWIPLPSSRRLDGLRACEPWPPKLAEKQFLQKLQALQAIARSPEISRRAAGRRAAEPCGTRLTWRSIPCWRA